MKKPLSLALICLTTTLTFSQDAEYPLGPNSQRYENIPKGTLTKYTWQSNIYANTLRDYYVYVPAQYDGTQPAALMVFQDGHTYVKEDGDFRVPVVFDNLISQGKMPITIGLFVNPGHDRNAAAPESPFRVTNRSIEYDEVSGTYGKFLIEEMIPELKKQYNISDDPRMRAISGLSSGGICAFSVAWFHPHQFHKVLSHIGSFTDIKGGHNYPSMIRKADKKNIKVFLQDGANDLDNQFGNWWLANQEMAAALKYKGYEYQFVGGKGAHNGKQGGSILPESLTWLWNDVVPKRIEASVYSIHQDLQEQVLYAGESAHFSYVEMKWKKMNEYNELINLTDAQKEQIIIVKEGKLKVNVGSLSREIGPNSVAFLLPGENGSIQNVAAGSSFYHMAYTSKKPMDLERGIQAGGSFIMPFEEVEFKPHDRGGVRNYFRRATAMCPYYEMHVTTLNPGIKSHEPHTHQAAEIVLMIEGHTREEVGNAVHYGNPGDLYFLPSNVPHAVQNIGNKPCMYFAFQWQ